MKSAKETIADAYLKNIKEVNEKRLRYGVNALGFAQDMIKQLHMQGFKIVKSNIISDDNIRRATKPE